MSLRDYFAGQALIGYIATRPRVDGSEWWTHEELATKCYRAADALLQERDPDFAEVKP